MLPEVFAILSASSRIQGNWLPF